MKTKKIIQLRVFKDVETAYGEELVNNFLQSHEILNVSTDVKDSGRVIAIVTYVITNTVLENSIQPKKESVNSANDNVEVLDLG